MSKWIKIQNNKIQLSLLIFNLKLEIYGPYQVSDIKT